MPKTNIVQPFDNFVQISVIIPTYNERENIQVLVTELLALSPDLSVIVVDDNSPDGTGKFLQDWMEAEVRLHVIPRSSKMGYASAIKSGMQYALTQGKDIIVQMDADLSHQSKYLPDMLESLATCDMVIGSRYVPGGGTQNCKWFRRLLSRSANQFARLVLKLPPRDCTNGYRCYRRELIERLVFDRITTEGYSFLIQLAYIFHYNNYHITEVPICFIDRQFGKSKISSNIVFESLFLVLRLSWSTFAQPLLKPRGVTMAEDYLKSQD
ncbi:MAG: polyprenol monophosphomannose synthase [Gemmatimonadota bacterium]|nr:polyprenol monophosphomannose synthase [Gemmatimonadota bacterium]